jgi:hypothetical protein
VGCLKKKNGDFWVKSLIPLKRMCCLCLFYRCVFDLCLLSLFLFFDNKRVFDFDEHVERVLNTREDDDDETIKFKFI